MSGMRKYEQWRRNTKQSDRSPFVIIECEWKIKLKDYILIISIVDDALLNFLRKIAQIQKEFCKTSLKIYFLKVFKLNIFEYFFRM